MERTFTLAEANGAVEELRPVVGRMVEGLRAGHADDAALLEQGMAMFDALARSFEVKK